MSSGKPKVLLVSSCRFSLISHKLGTFSSDVYCHFQDMISGKPLTKYTDGVSGTINLHSIVWPLGTAKVGCRRTKNGWLSIWEGALKFFKLVQVFLFVQIAVKKIQQIGPNVHLVQFGLILVNMAIKLQCSVHLYIQSAR